MRSRRLCAGRDAIPAFPRRSVRPVTSSKSSELGPILTPPNNRLAIADADAANIRPNPKGLVPSPPLSSLLIDVKSEATLSRWSEARRLAPDKWDLGVAGRDDRLGLLEIGDQAQTPLPGANCFSDPPERLKSSPS